MWWAEDRAIWSPVKSKPPQELSSPAGTFWTTLDCRTHAKRDYYGRVFYPNLTFFCLPSVVHLVFICRGGWSHHTELQELQPGDPGCVWVRLRGGARQRWCRSWKSAGQVDPPQPWLFLFFLFCADVGFKFTVNSKIISLFFFSNLVCWG